MSEYPESEKLAAASADRSAVVDFLEWAQGNRLHLMATDDGRPYAVNTQDKIFDWLEIDQDKLEQERRAMLKQLREGQR